MIGHPCQRFGISVVEKAGSAVAERPLRMVFVNPTAGRHALRLEPKQRLDPFRMGVVADRPQSVRITFRVGIPRSEQILPRTSPVRIPAGVHPPVIQLHTLFEVTVDKLHLVFIRSMEHLGEIGRTGRFEDRFGQTASRTRQVMVVHPAAPHVLRRVARPVPEHHYDQRRANLLARFKVQARFNLSDANVQRRVGLPVERSFPLRRPTYGGHHAPGSAVPLRIEERQVLGRRETVPESADLFGLLPAELHPVRLEILRSRVPSLVVVQVNVVFPVQSERNVQRQQVFEDSGFRPAVIFEIDDPLHGRVIGITNDLAAHLQAGSGIGISPRLPFAGGIRRTGFHFQFAAA